MVIAKATPRRIVFEEWQRTVIQPSPFEVELRTGIDSLNFKRSEKKGEEFTEKRAQRRRGKTGGVGGGGEGAGRVESRKDREGWRRGRKGHRNSRIKKDN